MMQTDEKMLFSREKAINCFIITSSYVAARAMFFGQTYVPNTSVSITSYGAVLNPAMALGIMIGAWFNGLSVGAGGFFMVWLIYPLMPILGAILSLLFFEFVYKKTQEALEGDFKETHADDGLLDA
jgi:glycerol uptake facilitator-like aquaporin